MAKNNIINKKSMGIGRNTILAILFMALFGFSKAIGLNSGNMSYKVLTMGGFFIFLIYFCCHKYNKKQIWIVAFLLLVGIITVAASGGLAMLLLAITLCILQELDIDQLLWLMEKIWRLCFWAIVILALLGVLKNESVTQVRLWGVETRYSLGYGHPNMLHAFFFIWTALASYNNRNMRFYHVVIGMILNLVVYKYSLSSAGMGLSALALFGFWVIHVLDRKWKRYHGVSALLGWFCCLPMALSFLGGIYVDDSVPFWFKLNQIFTGRLNILHSYLTNYRITLFGQSLAGGSLPICDNAYGYTLLKYGIAPFGLLALGYSMIIYRAVKTDNLQKIFFCLLFLMYGVTEQFMQNCYMNCSLLFLAELVWDTMDTRKRKVGLEGCGAHE